MLFKTILDAPMRTVRVSDTVTHSTYTHSYPADIPAAIGANTAFVGFGGGTGAAQFQGNINTWTYTVEYWKKKRQGALRTRRELVGDNRKTHNPSVHYGYVRFTGLLRFAGPFSPISRGTDATLQFGVE